MPTTPSTVGTDHQHALASPETSSAIIRTNSPKACAAPENTTHHAHTLTATDEDFRHADLDKLKVIGAEFSQVGEKLQDLLARYEKLNDSNIGAKTALTEQIRELLMSASQQHATARRAIIGMQLMRLGMQRERWVSGVSVTSTTRLAVSITRREYLGKAYQPCHFIVRQLYRLYL